MPDVLGVDFGNVISLKTGKIAGYAGYEPGMSVEDYLRAFREEVCGATLALWLLSRLRFGPNIHYVSKCKPGSEHLIRAWLEARRHFAFTGIPADHMHFCPERPEKAPICRDLGIDVFIDDRWTVLRHMELMKLRILFNPCEEELDLYAADAQQTRQTDGKVEIVRDWKGALELLLPEFFVSSRAG